MEKKSLLIIGALCLSAALIVWRVRAPSTTSTERQENQSAGALEAVPSAAQAAPVGERSSSQSNVPDSHRVVATATATARIAVSPPLSATSTAPSEPPPAIAPATVLENMRTTIRQY